MELYFTDESERREAAGREAVVVAQQLGDPSAQLVALYSRQWSVLGPNGIEERKGAAAELVRIAEEVGDGEMAFRGHYMRLRTRSSSATSTPPTRPWRRAESWPRTPPAVLHLADLVLRATNAIAEGRLAEGMALAREAFALGQRAAPQVAGTAFGAQLGMHGGLVADFDEILPRFRELPGRIPGEPTWPAAVAWHCTEAGLLDEARASFDAVAAAGFGRMPRNGNWVTAVRFLSLACGRLGDGLRAAELYPLLLPYQGRFAITTTGGARFSSNDGPLGVLAATMGRLDAAARHFEEALRLDASCRTYAYRVLTARDYARLLVRRQGPGDVERARDVVDEAVVTARTAGMEARVHELGELRP